MSYLISYLSEYPLSDVEYDRIRFHPLDPCGSQKTLRPTRSGRFHEYLPCQPVLPGTTKNPFESAFPEYAIRYEAILQVSFGDVAVDLGSGIPVVARLRTGQ